MSQPIPFGKYLLLERINVGGMAEVFKAKAFGIEGFERILAIKRILPNMADDDEFINMFIDEARIAVQLSHANIVPIYELGKLDNQYYIAMEYVPGRDLRQLLDRVRKEEKRLPTPIAAFITSKICEGLDYAHRKTDALGKPLGVIHRDVSPQNILLGYDGAVKITDFGIVKAEDRASKTQAGVLKGKFAYMSPEQVRGLEIDSRSDIFAVGILLYEMLTGQRLFVGESDFATLEKVRAAQVTPPREHNPDIPEELERVMLKALARERDERYPSAIALADDLAPFMALPDGIATTKSLIELMAEEYAPELAAEQQRMESYATLPPPSTQSRRMVEDHLAAPTAAETWSDDNQAEKTMIFQSDFSSLKDGGLATQLLEATPIDVATDERPTLAMDSDEAQKRLGPKLAAPRAPQLRKHMFWAVGAFLAATVCLALYLTMGARDGSLNVTSVPTTQVSLFLDNVLVASHTPYSQSGVPAGEHRLVARANGFRDKAYRFELVAGAPADIRVELERDQSLVVPGEATLEISSDPQMASVRMGGLPQGTTPVTLQHPDTAHPIVLEISKPGFETQTTTVNFGANERQKTVHVKLSPNGLEAPRPSSSGQGPSQPATLTITSRPSGSAIFVGGVQHGTTPATLSRLDSQATYSVEVTHEGYRSSELVVKMDGRTDVNVDTTLAPLRAARRLGGGCGGTGAKLSVMALEVSDCRVTVGKVALGVAPMYRKDAPVGRCLIDVRCPNGKHFAIWKALRGGRDEKIVIKPDDWQQP